MRLLVVYEEHGRYGTPMIARHLLGALRADVAVTVVAPNAATATWIASERPESAVVALAPVSTWRNLRALWRYRTLIRRIRPDIVQLTLPTPTVGTRYLALVVRLARGVRCVGVEHMH